VTSELVTNAVRAAGAVIYVRLLLFGASVVIEVWDGDPAPPLPQQAAGADEGGRGLSIVAALAANWNWFPTPHGGKVVCAELPIPLR
jgi:anti-sigma regulatory factor (Ser/Thr protein kinase)